MSYEHDLFIQKFKKVEQAIRTSPDTPPDANFKWLEDQMGKGPLQAKMALCRNTRNFIQHESDYENFITISQGMMDVLDYLYATLVKPICKDIMEPAGICSVSCMSQIRQLLSVLSTKDKVVVVDDYNRIFSTVDSQAVVKYIALYGVQGTVSNLVKFTGIQYDCNVVSAYSQVNPNMHGLTIVTDTGSVAEPIMGIIQ